MVLIVRRKIFSFNPDVAVGFHQNVSLLQRSLSCVKDGRCWWSCSLYTSSFCCANILTLITIRVSTMGSDSRLGRGGGGWGDFPLTNTLHLTVRMS